MQSRTNEQCMCSFLALCALLSSAVIVMRMLLATSSPPAQRRLDGLEAAFEGLQGRGFRARAVNPRATAINSGLAF